MAIGGGGRDAARLARLVGATGAPVRLLGPRRARRPPRPLRLRRRLRHALPEPVGRARAGGLRHRVPRGGGGGGAPGGRRQRRRGRGRRRTARPASWSPSRRPGRRRRTPSASSSTTPTSRPAWATPAAPGPWPLLLRRARGPAGRPRGWEAARDAAGATVPRPRPATRSCVDLGLATALLVARPARWPPSAPASFGLVHAASRSGLLRPRHRALLLAPTPPACRGAAPSRVDIAGLFLLAGHVAPRRVRRLLRVALAVQVVAVVAAASIRPFTEVAFGILAPMFGLGLMGLWGAPPRHVPRPRAAGAVLTLHVAPVPGWTRMRRWLTRRPRRWRSRRRPSEILDLLLDFDAYPTWAHDLKGVTVDSRDDEGRAREVTFRAAAMGRSTSYTLRYDHDDDARWSWALVRGDIMRQLDGCYQLEPGGHAGPHARHLPPRRRARRPAARVREAPGRAEDRPHRPPRAARPRPAVSDPGPPVHGQGRGGQDHDRGRHRAAVRRRRPAHGRAVAPTRPTRWPTPSTCRSARSPRPICERLWGQQLDAQERMEEGWHEIQALPARGVPVGRRRRARGGGAVGHPGPRRDLRPDRHQGLRRRRGSGTSSSSTARRPPRRSGSCRSPTSCARYMERLFPVGRRVNKVVGPVLSG